MHLDSKKKDKSGEGATTIMTKIFAKIPYANPVRDPSQELALLLDQETRQILDYGQYQSGSDGNQPSSYQLNKGHISLKK